MPVLKTPYWVRSHALRILPAISSPDRISVISGTRCSASQMSKNCFIPSQKKPCSMRLIVSLAMPVRSATSFCVKPNSRRRFFKKPAIFKRASFKVFSFISFLILITAPKKTPMGLVWEYRDIMHP